MRKKQLAHARSYPRMRTDAVNQLNRLELNHEKRTHDAGSNPRP